MRNVASKFLKLFNKTAKYDKALGIHTNGVDNNYPDFVESIIAESVTASTCADMMTSYLTGKGFGKESNKIIVHKEKETTLLQFTKSVSESISEHKGVYIHVNYDGNLDIKILDVLPFSDCRVGKKDDDNYNGKILVCNDWSTRKNFKKARVVDVYNSDKKIIQEQKYSGSQLH